MGTVARVTEINATSPNGFEDAIKVGVDRAAQTLRNITSAWVKDQRVEISDGKIVNYQVNMLVTFVLDDTQGSKL
jgi:dodecin